jgi:hypothetical protein
VRDFLARMSIVAAAFWLAAVPRAGTEAAGEGSGAPAGGKTESRAWPVDIPIHLASSFGEYREGHLHAGVDIRCFGREGVPCRAVGDGHVSRLRASPYGYGQAVYVRLGTGETVVYAHLSEFSAAIDSVVRAAQEEKGAYEIDVYPKRGALPVRRGEIVGYTGRTGTAAPHLHWEVRDAAENPVNPLDHGWSLRDELSPTISRIEWLPLSEESRIGGSCSPAVVELRSFDAHTFAARETVEVSGRLGIGVQVYDRLDEESGRLAPYGIELVVDGSVLASLELKRFSYDHTAEVELAYDMAKARTKDQHFVLLFERAGESLWDRAFVRGGVIATDTTSAPSTDSSRVHTAVVRAYDYAGNVATASIPFVVASPAAAARVPHPPRSSGGRGTGNRGELSGCYFFEGLLSVEGPVDETSGAELAPHSEQQQGDSEKRVPRETVYAIPTFGRTPRTLRVTNRGTTIDLHVVPARRGSAGEYDFGDIGAGISLTSGCLYSDAFLYLSRWEGDARRRIPEGSGMRLVAPAVRFGPMSAAFKTPVEIRFELPRPASAKEAVFRFDPRKGAWSMCASAARGSSIGAGVREPGVYAVLSDTLAPSVGAPQLRTIKTRATGESYREIVAAVVDGGSGVDAERTVVYVDGKKRIARWDGFSQKVFVPLRGKNIIGVHDLRIVALDRLGNAAELATRFEVPPPAPKGGAQGRR